MPMGSLCEPVPVSPARWIRVEKVAHSEPHEAPGRFAHFHDAVELVWFEQVHGELVCEDGVLPLDAGTAVLIPSMRHHDFVISAGAQRWVLAQFDPTLIADQLDLPRTCLVAAFPEAKRARLAVLFDWLLEAAADPTPHARTLSRLVELALVEILAHASAPSARPDVRMARLHRLRPALDLLARSPASPPTLEVAASACHLSPAYFSRLFKRVFGLNFSDYARSYRLRLAAQRLVAGGARVGEIAFELGFATPAHFAMLFQKRFGVSPRAYRSGRRGQDLDGK